MGSSTILFVDSRCLNGAWSNVFADVLPGHSRVVVRCGKGIGNESAHVRKGLALREASTFHASTLTVSVTCVTTTWSLQTP